MRKFVCLVCGYIHEGYSAPEVCPICKVSAEMFEEVIGEHNTNGVFKQFKVEKKLRKMKL